MTNPTDRLREKIKEILLARELAALRCPPGLSGFLDDQWPEAVDLSPAAWGKIFRFMPRTTQPWACLPVGYREAKVGNWITFEFGAPPALPPVPACYVVLFDGSPIYVGQTENLRQRFRGHGFHLVANRDEPAPMWLTPWGMFNAFRVQFKRRTSTRRGDWLMHEARLIKRLNPTFNRT